MTFDELCQMEPRLRDLEREAAEFAAKQDREPCRCANASWYGWGEFEGNGFKARMSKLIGTSPRAARLRRTGVTRTDPVRRARHRLVG